MNEDLRKEIAKVELDNDVEVTHVCMDRDGFVCAYFEEPLCGFVSGTWGHNVARCVGIEIDVPKDHDWKTPIYVKGNK